MNQEIIALLEASVAPETPPPDAEWGRFAAEASMLRERLRARYGTLLIPRR